MDHVRYIAMMMLPTFGPRDYRPSFQTIGVCLPPRLRAHSFIIQSDAEAWWRENRHKSQWKNSDGNRKSLKLLDVMSTIDKWDGWPPNISILELSTEAMKAWSSHLGVG